MARPTNITLCSFCGKSHAEVKKLIAGPGVYICDNCVVLCKQVLDKELASQARKQKPRINIAKPAEIKRQLDLQCIGGPCQENVGGRGSQSLQADSSGTVGFRGCQRERSC